MQDLNDSEDIPADIVRCAGLRVDSRIDGLQATRPAAPSPGSHSESDLDAAAAIVGSTLFGGAVWFTLALWLI